MKMYYANNGNLKIEEREVVRQTTSSVFIERTSAGRLGERSEAKRSERGAWFEFHEEAKNHLIERVLLEAANAQMLKVQSL